MLGSSILLGTDEIPILMLTLCHPLSLQCVMMYERGEGWRERGKKGERGFELAMYPVRSISTLDLDVPSEKGNSIAELSFCG